jgi:hypothetical protein
MLYKVMNVMNKRKFMNGMNIIIIILLTCGIIIRKY